jgi:hypothetical protein
MQSNRLPRAQPSTTTKKQSRAEPAVAAHRIPSRFWRRALMRGRGGGSARCRGQGVIRGVVARSDAEVRPRARWQGYVRFESVASLLRCGGRASNSSASPTHHRQAAAHQGAYRAKLACWRVWAKQQVCVEIFCHLHEGLRRSDQSTRPSSSPASLWWTPEPALWGQSDRVLHRRSLGARKNSKERAKFRGHAQECRLVLSSSRSWLWSLELQSWTRRRPSPRESRSALGLGIDQKHGSAVLAPVYRPHSHTVQH